MISDDDRPIWQREIFLGKKPVEFPYGYVLKGGEQKGFFPEDEFLEAYEQKQEKVAYAWSPLHDHFVLSEQIPALLPAVRKRRVQQSLTRWKSALTKVAILLPLLGYFVIGGYRELGFAYFSQTTFAVFMMLFFIFGLSPLYEAWRARRIAKTLTMERLREEIEEVRFERWMLTQRAWVTSTMIGLLVLISLLQLSYGGFGETARRFGILGRASIGEEWWRVWTAPFLHGNTLHLFMNALALKYLGKRLEVLANWPHLLMAYTLSMLAGSYCSLFFMAQDAVGVGASGGILGLLGFLLVFETIHPRLTPRPARKRLLVTLCSVAIIGLVGVQFIDNAAHAGGLVMGGLYAVIAFPSSRSPHRPAMRSLDWVLGGLSALLYLWGLLFTLSHLLSTP